MRKASLFYQLLVFFPALLFFPLGKVAAQNRPGDHASEADKLRRPLIEVLIELNKTRGVYFLFSQQSLGKTPVNSPAAAVTLPVEKILVMVLKNTGLYFKKVDDRTFVILGRKHVDNPAGFDTAAGREF